MWALVTLEVIMYINFTQNSFFFFFCLTYSTTRVYLYILMWVNLYFQIVCVSLFNLAFQLDCTVS